MKRFFDLAMEPINPRQLGFIRIGIGFFFFLESIYFFRVHLIEDYLIAPKFHFQYHFLPLEPLHETTLQFMLWVLLVSSILFILGRFTKAAILIYGIIFSYFMLLDKVFYNNHIYLMSLLCFMFFFIPLDDALVPGRKDQKNFRAKNWHLWLLKFQVVVVYFYGGVAKMTKDWLVHKEPVQTLLRNSGIQSDLVTDFICYGGLVFDLSIGFLLLFPGTRYLAFAGVVIFNIGNHLLFDDINIFPFLMLFMTIIFIDNKRFGEVSRPNVQTSASPLAVFVLSLFCLFQILFPLRNLMIPGNVDWTGEAVRFSWRMKAQTRKIEQMDFKIYDLDSRTIFPVDIDRHINKIQEVQMAQYPQMMLQFAHYIAEDARKRHRKANIMVKLDSKISMNKREAQPVVDPNTDLLKLKWSSWHNEWILPLKERD